MVQDYLGDKLNSLTFKPSLVHRIDKDTSGLLLVAKTEYAKAYLGKQFFEKTTQRRYQALVWGNVKEDEGTIVGALARDPRDRMLFSVFPEGENPFAKHAVTHYKVLERFGYVTLVECRLETGRTHQIRVHMKDIGHPVVGDKKYGAKSNPIGRICLHAKYIEFDHPTKGKRMKFEAPLPKKMSIFLNKDGLMYLALSKVSKVTHEEHKTIKLEKGFNKTNNKSYLCNL